MNIFVGEWVGECVSRWIY